MGCHGMPLNHEPGKIQLLGSPTVPSKICARCWLNCRTLTALILARDQLWLQTMTFYDYVSGYSIICIIYIYIMVSVYGIYICILQDITSIYYNNFIKPLIFPKSPEYEKYAQHPGPSVWPFFICIPWGSRPHPPLDSSGETSDDCSPGSCVTGAEEYSMVNCLVVDLPLWKMMDLKSVGVTIPNIWKNKSHVPNHQPVIECHHWLVTFNTTSWWVSLY